MKGRQSRLHPHSFPGPHQALLVNEDSTSQELQSSLRDLLKVTLQPLPTGLTEHSIFVTVHLLAQMLTKWTEEDPGPREAGTDELAEVLLLSHLPVTRTLGSSPAAGRGPGHGVGYRPQ